MKIIIRDLDGIYQQSNLQEEPGHTVRSVFLQQISGDQIATVDFSDSTQKVLDLHPMNYRMGAPEVSCFIALPQIRSIDYVLDLTERWTDHPISEQRTNVEWGESPAYHYVNMSRSVPDTSGCLTPNPDGYGWVAIDDVRPAPLYASRGDSGRVRVSFSEEDDRAHYEQELQEAREGMQARIDAIRELLGERLEADREGEQNAERN